METLKLLSVQNVEVIKLWLIWPYGFQDVVCSTLNIRDYSLLCASYFEGIGVMVLQNAEILMTFLW